MTDSKKPGSGSRSNRRRGRSSSAPRAAERPVTPPREEFSDSEYWDDEEPREREARDTRAAHPEDDRNRDDRAPRRDSHPDDEDFEDEAEYRGRDRGGRESGRERERESRSRPGDEYLVQVAYDRGSRNFVASYFEFPEIRVQRPTRDAALREAEAKLEDHLAALKKRGGAMPEAWIQRGLPEVLQLKLSQGLLKKLEQCARTERVSMEQLVTELISANIDRRNEPARGNEKHPPRQGGGGNQRSGQGGGGNRRQGNRNANFQHTMDSRENFMEYVRNLEKGGGYPKKR